MTPIAWIGLIGWTVTIFTVGWTVGFWTGVHLERDSPPPGDDPMISKETMKRIDQVRANVRALSQDQLVEFVTAIAVQFIDGDTINEEYEEFHTFVEELVDESKVLAPVVIPSPIRR